MFKPIQNVCFTYFQDNLPCCHILSLWMRLKSMWSRELTVSTPITYRVGSEKPANSLGLEVLQSSKTLLIKCPFITSWSFLKNIINDTRIWGSHFHFEVFVFNVYLIYWKNIECWCVLYTCVKINTQSLDERLEKNLFKKQDIVRLHFICSRSWEYCFLPEIGMQLASDPMFY